MRIYTDTVTTSANAATLGSRRKPFVSLLSDFGSRDPSAGIMRAVVAGICPEANVVDITHDVDKFSIRDGALLLWSAAPFLPVGAHVAVVDPGVGTERKGVALQTARGDYLVGPDNGLLMPAAARLGGITAAHLLEEPRYALPDVSSSFHGRDVFAPAGAHLAAGVPIDELGPAFDPRRLLDLEWPRPEIRAGVLRARAVYVDTFGNVKLAALADELSSALPGLRVGERLVVRVDESGTRRELPVTWATTFGQVAVGDPLLTADAYGRVALAVHEGSAASRYDITVDSMLEVTRPAPPRPQRRQPPTSPLASPGPTRPGPPTRPGASPAPIRPGAPPGPPRGQVPPGPPRGQTPPRPPGR